MVLYAASLIHKSITLLNKKDVPLNFLHIHALTKITNDILKGRIRGVPIELMITSIAELIVNSYFLDYSMSNSNAITSSQSIEIDTIGRHCGYCFQMLDDLKSFLSSNDNLQKNIIVSYLYGTCSKKERAKLSEENINAEYIRNLIFKYKIIDLILEDISLKMSFTKRSISVLEKTNPDYCVDFNCFLNETFKTHFQKCNLIYENIF